MKKGTLVCEYSLSPVLPVIVRVTEPEQQEADQDDIEEIIRENKHDPADRNKIIRTESADSGFDINEDILTNYVSERNLILHWILSWVVSFYLEILSNI